MFSHAKIFGDCLLYATRCFICYFFLFFWSDLRDPIACSLLGGGIRSQNINYKVTRICTSIMLSWYFVPPLSFPAHRFSRGIPSSLPIASSPYDSAAALLFLPSKYRPSCYHHRRDTLAPGLQADRSQRSIIGRVAIYYANMFYLLLMYVLIPSKPASTVASSNDGYYQLPPPCLFSCLPASCRTTLCWKLLRACSILGVSTHVSALNNNTACVTALENSPTPSDPPPPGSKSATTAPNYSSPSEGCLPLQDSHHLPPSPPKLDI